MEVTKRDNSTEPQNIDKIHRVLERASEGVDNISISDIEFNAQLYFFDGIKTTEIHDSLIRSAVDLTTLENPQYDIPAARLLLTKLRKDVWGESEPPRLWEHIKRLINAGVYTEEITKYYTKSEILKIGKFINHDRDEKFKFAGLQQMVDKYLCKDRNKGVVHETPQFAYMLVAMVLLHNEPKDKRLELVKQAYDYFSSFKINLPTPIMCGVRTPVKQFASCVLIDVDDTLDSITASTTALMKYTANRAGIGLNVGRIRGINSSIRNGDVIHTGLIPFLKVFESGVKSCTQNAVRGGSATVYTTWWHPEILETIVLKNNSGTDDNRVKKLDYNITFDRLFFKRLQAGENISLFSTSDAPDLYEVFGTEKFEEVYLRYELDESVTRKTIPAMKLAELFVRERIETGRIYAYFIDNEYKQGVWKDVIYQSNLCVEILQKTTPIQHIDDKDGEIGICILSAINLLETKKEEIPKVSSMIVRLLDNLIDYQDYPVKAGENFTKNRRSLGIGVTNYAGWLASNELMYDDSLATANSVDELFELIQYSLLDASANLAKERGACAKFNETKYADGSLPIDRQNEYIKTHTDRDYTCDWEKLRRKIKRYGLRNSTLSAQMPCESSSIIQNSTNGIEPVKALLINKQSKHGNLKLIVPNYETHAAFYITAFNCDNKHINTHCGIIQKWDDMSISLNHQYDYKDTEIPLGEVLGDVIDAYRKGCKTLYYANTRDEDREANCSGGACSI